MMLLILTDIYTAQKHHFGPLPVGQSVALQRHRAQHAF